MTAVARLSILGGSSAFTPALAHALASAADGLPPMRIALYGRDEARVATICRFANLIGEAMSVQHRYSATTDLDEALDGADVVINQIRVGGFAGRSHDETFPLLHGVPGDETIGPGGLASALRSVPVFMEIGRRVAAIAPRAAFVQMSNPLGIGVAALSSIPGLRPFGLCELPESTLRAGCRLVGISVDDVDAYYVGANHQGWFLSIRDACGRERLPDILREQVARSEDYSDGVDAASAARAGALPLPYIRLYEHTERAVTRARSRAIDRGIELGSLARDLFEHFARTEDPTLPSALSRRPTPWNELALVPALQSLFDGKPRRLAVSSRNRGYLLGVPDDAVVEKFGYQVPGRTRLPGQFLGANDPRLDRITGFLTSLGRFESLAVATALDPTEDAVFDCLRSHPLGIAPDVCRALVPHVLHIVVESTSLGVRP